MRLKLSIVLAFALALAGVAHADGVGVGEAAPDFSLRSYDGRAHKLSDHQGEIVVLEWLNPDCPYVKRVHNEKIMSSLYNKYKGKKVTWMAINSSHFASDDDNKAWAEKHGLDYPILNDSNGEVGKLYGAKTTPHMFVIDDAGRVAYQGAIDDDRSGDRELANRKNYVDGSLSQLMAGSKVSPAMTQPYGCSVKYKS